MNDLQTISPKSGLVTFTLCFFFGCFGVHRFYAGKIGTGILMLLTFGGLGFWMLYDLFSIVCKNFTDSQGRVIEIVKNPKAPRNIIIAFVCFYILLFGTITLCVSISISGLKHVGKDELAALRQNNIPLAYSYTSLDFQKNVSIDTFKKFINSYPQFINNVDSTFTDIEYKDNDGLIKGTISMKDGSSLPIKIVLVKENNQWKINEIYLEKSDNEKAKSDESSKASDAQTSDTETTTGDE
jgi:hypothetical protein